jgi:hypothetical protein
MPRQSEVLGADEIWDVERRAKREVEPNSRRLLDGFA